MKRSEAIKYRNAIAKGAKSLSNSDVKQAIHVLPIWQVKTEYSPNDRVRFGNVGYTVNKKHTSQPGQTPDKSPLYDKL